MTPAYVIKLPCRPDGRPGGVGIMRAETSTPVCRWPDAAACATLIRHMRGVFATGVIEWDGELFRLQDHQWQDLFDWARQCAESAEPAEA